MLLYALLHLTGYRPDAGRAAELSGSGAAVHAGPSRVRPHARRRGHHRPAGPGLRQRRGHGASAAKMLAARFNTEDLPAVDHYIYGICGDGDLMEGVAAEAASLAGHLELGNLIFLYDDNEISIEGNTDIAFAEDVRKRFEAVRLARATSATATTTRRSRRAIQRAQAVTDKPSLIICRNGHRPRGARTRPARPAPRGAAGAGGARLTKEALGWPQEPAFCARRGPGVLRRAEGGEAGAKPAGGRRASTPGAQAHPEKARALGRAQEPARCPRTWTSSWWRRPGATSRWRPASCRRW